VLVPSLSSASREPTTQAAPPMSALIWSMLAAGLMEIPPLRRKPYDVSIYF